MGCKIAKLQPVYYEYEDSPEELPMCECNTFSTVENVQQFDSREYFAKSKAFAIQKFGVLLGEYVVGISMQILIDGKQQLLEYKGSGKVEKAFTFKLEEHEHIVGISVTYTDQAISSMHLTTSGDRVFVAESKCGAGPNTKEYDLDIHHKALVGLRCRCREYLESMHIYVGVRVDLLTDEEIERHGIVKL